MTHVAICIATYRRPSMLRRALRSLEDLEFRKNPEPAITIIVVDNDAQASARAVLAAFDSRFSMQYAVEPRRGIAFARNTAIATARMADFIAFLDDDEHVSPEWLDELLTVQHACNAPIVAGPVLPHFEDPPPLWLVEGGFFHRRRHATGSHLDSVGAGNVLISGDVIRSMSPAWFDPRFNFTGGEDTHFFRRAATMGFSITWANEAVAYEFVPADRISQHYLVSRARNGANHWTRVELELRPSFAHLTARFGAGLLRVAQGSLVRVLSPALSRAQQLRARIRFAEGLGNLDAFAGRVYNAYGPREL